VADHEIITRPEWSALAPLAPLVPVITFEGWFVHYVGSADMWRDSLKRFHVPTQAESSALMRALQLDAQSTARGYTDFEYSFAIDPAGRIFEGRGWEFQQAATLHNNAHTWSVVYLGGPDTPLTDEAKAALLWLVQEGARRKPAIAYVKPHSAVYATACPGDLLREYVPFLNDHLHDTGPAPGPAPTPPTPVKAPRNDMLIAAPKWQQTHPSRTPTVGIGDNNTIIARNGAKFVNQKGTSTPVPVQAGAHLVGIFETFDANHVSTGFTVQASKDSSGNPDFHYPWPPKP